MSTQKYFLLFFFESFVDFCFCDTEVNAGPAAIAKTFLGNKGAYPPEDIHILEQTFVEFFDLCAKAINLNNTLIGPDQREFQAHLQKGYEALQNDILPLLSH